MSEKTIDFESMKQDISDEALRGVADLADKQVKSEKRINDLSLLLEAEQAILRDLVEVKLPDMMLEIGLESFVLSDGTSIRIEKFYAAKIPDDKRQEAFEWLRGNGHESLIKRAISCKFGKGQDALASKVIAALAKLKVAAEDKESVHPQTLKAFVREQIEEGKALPTDLLGVYVGNRAKVTPSKQ